MPTDPDATSESGLDRYPISCPECGHGTLRVSDAVYADCDNCDAAVERNEVGI